jgi:uncharacterized membrane protein
MTTTHRKKIWQDADMQRIISRTLRTGVIISAVLVMTGGLLYLVKYGASVPDHHAFLGKPSDFLHFRGILSDAFSWRSRGIIQLGLLALIATPILRVALSAWIFLKERDFTYMVVSLIVLLFLLYSFTGGVRL